VYLKRASASEVVGSTNFGMYGERREFVCYQTGCLVEVSNDDNTSRKKKAGVAKELQQAMAIDSSIGPARCSSSVGEPRRRQPVTRTRRLGYSLDRSLAWIIDDGERGMGSAIGLRKNWQAVDDVEEVPGK
jgi:hypothetical protein